MVHGWHAIMEHIDSSQIHLWLAFLDEITDPQLLSEYQRLLSRDEVQKQQRFYFERDRNRYLVTRAMVRTVLSKYADVAPRDWRFAVNAYGRPSIANARIATGMDFNVSYTDGLIVLGVTCGRALGVDVENLRTRQVGMEIADWYFAPEEAAALRALPGEQQHRRFFEYWTLKESFIKARGTGLSTPLDQFAFRLDGAAAHLGLSLAPNVPDCRDDWAFWYFEEAQEYLVAVCAARLHDCACRLSLSRTVPLVRESVLDSRPSRTAAGADRRGRAKLRM
jgi:4'-phosphopantetheinyl transferase